MGIEAVYEALSPGRDWWTWRACMQVRCPWCRARPGQACITFTGQKLTIGDRVHPSRKEAACGPPVQAGSRA